MPEYPVHENYIPLDSTDVRAVYETFTKITPEIPRDETVPAKIARLLAVGELLIECIEAFGKDPTLDKATNSVEKALLQTLKYYASSKG